MKTKTALFFTASLILLLATGYMLWSLGGVRESGRGSGGVRWVSPVKTALGAPVPDFQAIDIKAVPLRLSEIKKIRVVNFWASWCAPCLEEMPSMAALAKIKAGEIEFIAVSSDANEKDMFEALRIFPEFNFNGIRIVFDPDKSLMRAYGVTGFPETFIVSADGRLLKKITGSVDWTNLPGTFFTEPTR